MKSTLYSGFALAALIMGALPAMAADHRDGPAATGDPASDINDVFAWMSADGKVNLVMTVFPAADEASAFSDSVQYVFHLSSGDGLAALGSDQTETLVICQFDADQAISCWVGDPTDGGDYADGDASDTAGLESRGGTFKVFAGLRNDPFFFRLDGFNDARAAVMGLAGDLEFNGDGCPTVSPELSATAVGILQSGDDFFEPLNGLAIAIQVDTASVTPGGPVLGVWASTHARPE